MAKRLLDVVLAFVLLLVLSPVLLLTALAVWREDGGSPFYRQVRVGRALRPFRMWKFRTMRQDADRTGGWSTASGDPRITRIGAILRRTSLDELPQLANVLVGDMSLVGPRPYVAPQLATVSAEDAARRHAVRPGMTGLAQVSGRSALSDAETLRYDLDYAAAPGAWRDLRLLGQTAMVVFRMRGVN